MTTTPEVIEALLKEAFAEGFASKETYNDKAENRSDDEREKYRQGYVTRLAAALSAQPADAARGGVAEIDTGDHVLHGPSGETWVVAYVRGDRLVCCGWPMRKHPNEHHPDALEALRKARGALDGAHEWLSGWASAEPYISRIERAIADADAALATAEAARPATDEREAFVVWRNKHINETGHLPNALEAWQVRAAQPAASQRAGEADVLLRVIQTLNQNPYNLTKSECIHTVELMLSAALAATPAPEGGEG